jgi:DNA-binding MarR family transcriptional regulator
VTSTEAPGAAIETTPTDATPVRTGQTDQTSGSYQARMESASESDRVFAADLSTRLIDVVKAFSAVKHRLYGPAHSDGFDIGLLVRLAKTGPTRASELAEQLCADPSTVSRQVAGLVKAGFLERKADPHDGRASILVATEAGEAKLADLKALRGRVFAPLIADWAVADRDRMLALLERFGTELLANIDTLKTISADVTRADAQPRRTL